MSTTDQGAGVQPNFTFYWIGMIMALLCVGLACSRNTELLWRLQPEGLPLCWAAGLIAILAFLAAEYWHQTAPSEDPAPSLSEVAESASLETEFADV